MGDVSLHTLNGPANVSFCSLVSEVTCLAPKVAARPQSSTFRETLINSVNILLGVGTLSLSYAFAKGGWLVAPLIVCIALCTGYTATALGRIQSDVVKVIHPDGVTTLCSGYYVRCLESAKSNIRRFAMASPSAERQRELEEDESFQQVNRSQEALSASANEVVDLESVRPEHQKGVWSVTWLGSEDPRWQLQYEGPELGGEEETVVAVVHSEREDETAKLIQERGPVQKRLVRQVFASAPTVERLEQYPHIGHASFGKAGRVFLNVLFVGELSIYLVALIVLSVSSSRVVFTSLTKFEMILVYAGLCLPTALVRDFSRLSFLSYFGLIACVIILGSLLYFGLTTSTREEGSLLHPSHNTSLFRYDNFSYSFSLVMGSFAGHSFFPAFRADMRKPERYQTVIRSSFAICCVYYLTVGILGYVMYGNDVSDIVTLDYPSNWFSKAVSLCISAVSYSNYGLASNVLCNALEHIAVSRFSIKPSWALYGPVRVGMTVLAVFGAWLIPNFGTILAFLGAAVSCVISLIFPFAAHIKLLSIRMGPLELGYNYLILFISCYFCVTGTINSLGFPL